MTTTYSLEDLMRVLWRQLEAPLFKRFVAEIERITAHEPEATRSDVIERVLEDVPEWSEETRAHFVTPVLNECPHFEALLRRCLDAQLSKIGGETSGVKVTGVDAAAGCHRVMCGLAAHLLEEWDGRVALSNAKSRPLVRRGIQRGVREAIDAEVQDRVGAILSDFERDRAEYEARVAEEEGEEGEEGEYASDEDGDGGAAGEEFDDEEGVALADRDIDGLLARAEQEKAEADAEEEEEADAEEEEAEGGDERTIDLLSGTAAEAMPTAAGGVLPMDRLAPAEEAEEAEEEEAW